MARREGSTCCGVPRAVLSPRSFCRRRLAHAAVAHACDGGFSECGRSWSTWLHSWAGAGKVRHLAIGGGVASALGAPLGLFIGDIVGRGGGRWGGGRGFDGRGDDPTGGD